MAEQGTTVDEVVIASDDVAAISGSEEVWTAHDLVAGLHDQEPVTAVSMNEGETPQQFADRLQNVATDLSRPAGVKGPDDAAWGAEARHERGAHKDDAPIVPGGPSALVDAATGEVLHEDATSDEAIAINEARNQEASK